MSRLRQVKSETFSLSLGRISLTNKASNIDNCLMFCGWYKIEVDNIRSSISGFFWCASLKCLKMLPLYLCAVILSFRVQLVIPIYERFLEKHSLSWHWNLYTRWLFCSSGGMDADKLFFVSRFLIFWLL